MAKKAAAPAKTDAKVPKKPKATGFAPLKFKEFTITQKGSGRFEVVNVKGKNVNGTEKVQILKDAKVLKIAPKVAKEEAAAQ